MTGRSRQTKPPVAETLRERGVYQLKITLTEIEPPIWRRIQVPGALTLDRLHRVLQGVMGWTGAHLHEFVIDGRRYVNRIPRRESRMSCLRGG